VASARSISARIFTFGSERQPKCGAAVKPHSIRRRVTAPEYGIRVDECHSRYAEHNGGVEQGTPYAFEGDLVNTSLQKAQAWQCTGLCHHGGDRSTIGAPDPDANLRERIRGDRTNVSRGNVEQAKLASGWVEKADGASVRRPMRALAGGALCIPEYPDVAAVALHNGDHIASVLAYLKEDRAAVG
jgi:hypothetical protein